MIKWGRGREGGGRAPKSITPSTLNESSLKDWPFIWACSFHICQQLKWWIMKLIEKTTTKKPSSVTMSLLQQICKLQHCQSVIFQYQSSYIIRWMFTHIMQTIPLVEKSRTSVTNITNNTRSENPVQWKSAHKVNISHMVWKILSDRRDCRHCQFIVTPLHTGLNEPLLTEGLQSVSLRPGRSLIAEDLMDGVRQITHHTKP